MIRKKKLYSKPRRLFEAQRIKEENALMEKYALKNKTEIWKTLAKVEYYRSRAKTLAYATQEEQEFLFKKLKDIGLNANSIADVLDLQIEDLLKRRLSTIVVEKGLTNTPKQARQMIVHKKVLINGKIINSPSYLVNVSEENTITIKTKKPEAKVEKEEAAKTEAETIE